MDKRIKTEMVARYTATDGKSFAGPDAKDRVASHQIHLDLLAKRGDFYKYMCCLFRPEFSSIKSLDESVESKLEHIANDAEELADDVIDLFGFFGADRWTQIKTYLTKGMPKKREKTKSRHNWTKATMGECAKVHIEDIVYWYYNLTDGAAKRQKLDQIIQSYANISNDLPK
jgi:hypothetical protein